MIVNLILMIMMPEYRGCAYDSTIDLSMTSSSRPGKVRKTSTGINIGMEDGLHFCDTIHLQWVADA